MNSWSVLFLVALPGEIAVRAGVDLASNLPGVILGHSRCRPDGHDAAPSGGIGAEQSAPRMAVGQRDPPSKCFRVLDRPRDVLIGGPLA
jgi:hypothetical protein